MKKLNFKKYLLYFATLFLVCIVGISGVFADTTTQTFNTFSTTAESLSSSIQCNNDICVVYGVNQYDYSMNFEWGSQNTKTCTNMSTVSGKLSLSKTSFGINNNDFKWSNVYIVNNNNSSNCNYQVGSEYTTFTCTTDTLSNNFKIGYSLNSMGGQYSYDSIIYRSIDITCDTSTTQIIENNNQNTQNIINNNNENTDKEIDSQKICEYIDKNNIELDGKRLDGNGNISDFSSTGITNYIKLNSNSELKVISTTNDAVGLCFYNTNKELISCEFESNLTLNQIITIPNNTSYLRATIRKSTNVPTFQLCKNGNQGLNDSINDLNDNMNNDDVTGATDEASDFFSSFSTDTFGLTSIITAPLNLIQSLTSSTCTQLHLPLPYLDNKYIDLPCMTTIYQTHFGTFFTMYQTITYGIIAYWVIVRIFNQVKDFKNPEHDEIEVVDL